MDDADLREQLVSILTPHYTDVRPEREMVTIRALMEMITPGGELDPRAIADVLPWVARDFWIPGTVATGNDIAQALRVRQPSRLIYLEARARAAPTSGALSLNLMASGAYVDNVSIKAGQQVGVSPSGVDVASGSLLTLDCASAGAAANVTVTAWIVPNTR